MLNFNIASTPGNALFLEELQNTINEHYRNLYTKDQNDRNKLGIAIDDDKHHLNYKIPGDNFQLVHHMRNNRISLVNYTAVFIGCNILLQIEYEKHEDNARNLSNLHGVLIKSDSK